jgi:hypothetical protein
MCVSLLWACEESEEEKQAKQIREELARRAIQKRDIEKGRKDAEKKREERDAKGDTVALSTEKLESFLPEICEAYKKEGALINSPAERNGNAFSSVEQTYSDGNKNVRIIIRDSNQGKSTHAGMSAVWQKRKSIRSREGVGRYVFLQDAFHAWESFAKKDKKAEILIDVSDRIYIQIAGYNQSNTADLHDFVKLLDLKRLAKF